MLHRRLYDLLQQRLTAYPVVAITGPRQAGKTTLAKTLLGNWPKPSVYLDLELPSDLARLRQPELFLKEHEGQLVVIDEIQRMPELFPLLRALVDQRREMGRFLILGSASPELLRQSSETLAGRIAYLELTPFHVREIPEGRLKNHWLRGGFPLAFLAGSDAAAFDWLRDFTRTFIERDLPQLGLSAPSQVLRNLLAMLTQVHGNLLNYSALSGSLGLTMPTVKRYVHYFEQAYFIRSLLPFHTNVSKRLVKTPKVFFRDSGVFHHLTNLGSVGDLYGSVFAGASWEGYVLQQVMANLKPEVLPYFYRTKDGSEVDLVLVRGNQPVAAIEVKFSANPTLTRGNRLAFTDLKAPLNLIVAPVEGDFPFDAEIRVCNLNGTWTHLDQWGLCI